LRDGCFAKAQCTEDERVGLLVTASAMQRTSGEDGSSGTSGKVLPCAAMIAGICPKIAGANAKNRGAVS